MCQFLGEELEGPLSVSVEGAGEGSVTGVGEVLGERNLTVDAFGDNVLSVSNIPGGSFTARHDLVKTCIHTLCVDAGLRVECEVFGAFRDLIPVQAMEQEEDLRPGRKRAGLLPDFSMDLPEPGAQDGHAALGNIRKTLAEVKVIGAVKSYYPRSGPLARRTKGVDRRGALVPGEYRRPLEALDSKYHGTADGDTGPLMRRLQSYGRLQLLVMGAWQEGTADLHSLLDLLADTKVRRMGLAMGRELSDRERAKVLSEYRRVLSVTAARATSGCLIGRLARFGPAFRAAAKRREWVRREGERMDEEREAHWTANVRGRGVMRGQIAF